MPSDPSTDQALRRSLRVGDWLVEPSLNRLSRSGHAVQVEPRAMDLLMYLVRNSGRVVPRAELIQAVWARQFVADATLSHTMAELRSALGDDARQPSFVETISKRGYRLIAPVSDAGEASPDTAGGPPAGDSLAAFPVPPSIAVLPFADMSPDRDQEYLCDGIVEEITNALAQIAGVRVAARTSAFAFRGKLEDAREIGRKLGVGSVLEGSVRRAGDRLRITVQLIGVADGYHLWSERFDGNDGDIFAFQDDIAAGVVERLKVKLLAGHGGALGRRHTANREAYDLFLRGRYFLGRRRPVDFQAAIAAFDKAIALDPTYAFPHLGIAEAFTMIGLWGYLPPAPACSRAKAAAARAVEIDDTLFEGHAWLGSVLYLHEWSWEEAARHCERALQLPAPGGTVEFGIGLHWLVRGEWDKAREVGRRLVAAEPLSAIVNAQVGALLTGLGDHDAAAAQTRTGARARPRDARGPLWPRFLPRGSGLGSMRPRICSRVQWTGDGRRAWWRCRRVLVRAGDRQGALDAVHALDETAGQRYVTPLIRALAWAALDERERTLELLAQAEVDRSPMLTLFLFGPATWPSRRSG